MDIDRFTLRRAELLMCGDIINMSGENVTILSKTILDKGKVLLVLQENMVARELILDSRVRVAAEI